MQGEKLQKSIDNLIDELFGTDESLEKAGKPESIAVAEKAPEKGKSIGDDQKPAMTADENGAKKEGEEDEEEGKKRGRPADLSQMSMRNMSTGESKGKFDASITEPAKKVPHETTVAKSYEVSEEDWEILQKAKAAQKEEDLRKAQKVQTDLIKSAVAEATQSIVKENESLKKSLEETQALIKSMAKKPQPRKSVSSVQVLEKSFSGDDESAPKQAGEKFSKSEMLDAAEALCKSGKLTVNHVIELEDTGFVYDPSVRKLIENELRKSQR